jgi:hypothetical protein
MPADIETYSRAVASPTLLLTVGLPCCGKTAAARRFEIEHAAFD